MNGVYSYSNKEKTVYLMSRFDSLKENTFTSSSSRKDNRRRDDRRRDDRRRDDRRRDDRRRDDRPRDDRNLFKEKKEKEFNTTEEDFPDLLKPAEDNKEKPKEKTKWLNVIEKQNETDNDNKKFIINPNDPFYWRGAQWTGPIMMRQKKPNKMWDNYFNMISQKKVSTIVIPHSGTEYSRDGTNWYKSWNDTFTQDQLQAMEDEKHEKMLERWSQSLEEIYEKYRLESERYYYETGELDEFAKAELDRIEYEKYAEQFEIDEEEEEEEEESDEYLEDD